MVCGPATLIPKHFASLGVQVEYDMDRALEWCDVANVLRIQLERQGAEVPFFPSLEEYHERFGVTSERLDRLSEPPIILHPGPMNRGVEIASEVADRDDAVILEQVENGVAVRMAVLYLLAGRLGGSED